MADCPDRCQRAQRQTCARVDDVELEDGDAVAETARSGARRSCARRWRARRCPNCCTCETNRHRADCRRRGCRACRARRAGRRDCAASSSWRYAPVVEGGRGETRHLFAATVGDVAGVQHELQLGPQLRHALHEAAQRHSPLGLVVHVQMRVGHLRHHKRRPRCAGAPPTRRTAPARCATPSARAR
jgi:hypothetical protein